MFHLSFICGVNAFFSFRDGLMKMKGVYESNPALGDPMSTEGQLNECSHRIDKLNTDITKYQTLLQEAECNGSPVGVRKYESTEHNGIGNGTTLSHHR